MRKKALMMAWLAALTAAGMIDASAAGSDSVRGGGVSGKAADVSPAISGSFYMRVPYAFKTPHQNLKSANIVCYADDESKFPIGSGSVTIPINGQPRTGTADVVLKPSPGKDLLDSRFYRCLISVVSDGKDTATPGNDTWTKEWAFTGPGSKLHVGGMIQ
jgi:hypothetical protein